MRANLAWLLIAVGCSSAQAETPELSLEEYTHCVLTRLLDAAGTDRGWEVIVLDENELALHVLPGHMLALDAGMIRFSTTPDELAHAIAHELGHAIAHHGWDDDHGVEEEREASRIAAELTSSAGFSLEQGVVLWERLAGEKRSVFVRLHPSPEENAHVLSASLRDAGERRRSAIGRDIGPACKKPRMDTDVAELRYASASVAEGGTHR